MVNITPPPPINPQVERTHISDKDPNRQKNKKKDEKKKEVEDEVILSDDNEDKKPQPNKKSDSPLSGHIDIEA